MDFGLGFHIELMDAHLKRIAHFLPLFADTGKDDFFRRNARLDRAAQLPFRDHISARAKTGKGADHGLIGVGFQRIADQRIRAIKRAGEYLVMAFQRRGGIAIKGRAHLFGNAAKGNFFGVQLAVLKGKMVHYLPI